MRESYQPKWPHLENHYKVAERLAQFDWVTVTEKLHGFNARFGRTLDGIFWVGSRNKVILEAPEGMTELPDDVEMLQGFTEFATEPARMRQIPHGYTFFGEWVGKGIQNGIDYGEEKKFFLFGIMVYERSSGANNPLTWPSIVRWARHLNTEHVPLIFEGKLWGQYTLDQLTQMAAGTSLASPTEDEREGIVINPWPPIIDEHGHHVIVKMKNPKFAERQSQRKSAPPPDLSNIHAFLEDYVTKERLAHVLADVEEEVSDVPYFPRYTGHVLRAYHHDVLREGEQDYEALSKEDKRLTGKILNKMVLPMLAEYRDEMAAGAMLEQSAQS